MTIVMTPTEARTPEAPARLVRGRGCWLWIVPRCPLCGRKHQHGGGHLDADPRALLGHRVRHCATKYRRAGQPSGYDLVAEVAQARDATKEANR
jgi:hypothetical protein